MKMLSVDEAKEQLGALIEAAKRGEEIVLTENGTPVARLSATETVSDEERRKEAGQRLLEKLRKGYDLGGRDWTRDDLHERGSLP
ncbi:type II toxin-antitoxin system prevent-host-death family antitoxin [Azospirillum sp. TSO35-2]|uniref:type II toxin-antitoxin system Phd/YefM family antitoxin n=1 Tax=Azospirillum sp. TSO35-2 TaxID=716796 RepID=UPI000D6054FA|nr:type II toxin-antitoxin system prevent-host-death family antitoxin [Azospirillum sp. TSO35-2]PWC31352.1 prevent-host-death protein [Azospirillum sp. TSO35-2]